MNPRLFSCTPKPFWKGVFSKRKEFAPRGSKFFPFRVDPFSEGMQCNAMLTVTLHVSVHIHLNYIFICHLLQCPRYAANC